MCTIYQTNREKRRLSFHIRDNKGRVYGRTAMYIAARNLRLIDAIPRKPVANYPGPTRSEPVSLENNTLESCRFSIPILD
jgi:hypothetical protein